MRLDRVRDGLLLLMVGTYSAGYAAIGLGLLVLVAVAQGFTGSWRWIRTPLDGALIALGITAGASALVSRWPATAWPSVLGLALMTLTVFPATLAYVQSNDHRLLRLLLVWIAGGVVAALWGLARFRPQGYPPISTPLLIHNGLGLTLMLGTVISLGLALGGSVRARWVPAIAVVVMAPVLALTLARASWIGAVAGVATLAFISTPRRRAALLVAVLAMAVAGSLVATQWPALRAEALSIPSLEANRSRLSLWSTAARIAADHPVLGVGFGAFGLAYGEYVPPEAPDPTAPFAHNVFLNFAAETGILGLAAATALFALALTTTWNWWRQTPTGTLSRDLGGTILATMVALLVTQLFDTTVMIVHLGVALFLLFALGAGGGRVLRAAP